MLVISRKRNEGTIIRFPGGFICRMVITKVEPNGKVKVGFVADQEIEIVREELIHEVHPQGLRKRPAGQ